MTEQGTARRCSCYGQDYLERLWANYGLKPNEVKKLREYEAYNAVTKNIKSKAAEYINNFETIVTSKENSFGMLGQSGSGKSHVSIAIGTALLTKKYKVVYMPYLEVMRELKANSMDDEYYNKLINKFKTAEVLVIDDLFKDKVKSGKLTGQLTEADMKHIYPILNYRYANKLPMIFSSECNVDMLLDLDEALAGRILETTGKNLIEIQGREYNYRLKKFREG